MNNCLNLREFKCQKIKYLLFLFAWAISAVHLPLKVYYHICEQPDHRSQQTARSRWIDLSDLRGRKAIENDFHEFDYVLAMDDDNYRLLEDICPAGFERKLSLFLDFSNEYSETQVPDPYYGGDQGFEHVFDLVESASKGLLEDIKKRFV